MTQRKKQVIGILVVFACVVCVDQVAKALVMRAFHEPTFRVPSDGPEFFRLTHQRNPGLVGGLFRTKPVMAYLAPVAASMVLLYLFRYLEASSKVQTLAYGLIAGGAVGNLIDRVRLGSVTDFLQFHFYFIPFDFPWKYYPAFNVADACICTGVFLLVVSWYFVEQDHAADPD